MSKANPAGAFAEDQVIVKVVDVPSVFGLTLIATLTVSECPSLSLTMYCPAAVYRNRW